jgi:hypothetical protein
MPSSPPLVSGVRACAAQGARGERQLAPGLHPPVPQRRLQRGGAGTLVELLPGLTGYLWLPCGASQWLRRPFRLTRRSRMFHACVRCIVASGWAALTAADARGPDGAHRARRRQEGAGRHCRRSQGAGGQGEPGELLAAKVLLLAHGASALLGYHMQ